jgi:hypothetical protein
MEVIWAFWGCVSERMSGQKVLGTDADSASGDMANDFINTGHRFHGEVSW